MLSAWTVFNLGGSLAILALGLVVLVVAPRRAGNLALAALALSQGAAFALSSLADVVPLEVIQPQSALHATLRAATVAALGVMAFTFPTALPPGERRVLLVPGLVAAAYTVASAGMIQAAFALGASTSMWRLLTAFFTAAALALSLLFALRARRDATPAAQGQYATMSTALLISPAIVNSPYSSLAHEQLHDLLAFGIILLVAALWLWNGARGVEPRVARNAAWAILVLALAGTFLGDPSIRGFGIRGLMALLTVALLVHSILRHQLLGIDVKLRWGLSKTTVAAVFIAVFFIASEGAQILFGADNEWIGLVGAGALVFALAPLQRAAERLAERAVPSAGATGPAVGPTDVYCRQVEHAWSDGHVDAPERLMLNDLRAHLGLTADEAERIEAEVAARSLRPAGVR